MIVLEPFDALNHTRYCTHCKVLRMFGMNDDPIGHNQQPNYPELFSTITALPGCDPLLLSAEGRQKLIPPEGWFVWARIAPGAMCLVDVYRYNNGNLRFDAISDTTANDGTIHAQFSLRDYDDLVVAYKSYDYEAIPDLATAGIVPPPSLSEVDLERGRMLVDITKDEGKRREIVYEDIESLDISWFAEHETLESYDPHVYRPLPACRITEDAGQLLDIMRGIGFAAGLSLSDADIFTALVATKLDLQ